MALAVFAKHALVAVVGLLTAALVPYNAHFVSTPPLTVAETAVQDLPSADITLAKLTPSLTQWGAPTNYTGYGPPGVALKVQTPGDVLHWTLEAWANETTPPTVRTCHSDSVHFNSYDWVFQSSGNSGGAQGTFQSTPTTVPARMGPDGDQCIARFGATGDWTLTVCVEGKDGGPLGYYRDPEGRLHYDPYDLCIHRTYRVG